MILAVILLVSDLRGIEQVQPLLAVNCRDQGLLIHPTMFAAAASMAPGFPAVLRLEDWDISYFDAEVLSDHSARFGNPVNRALWRSTHPPTMVIDHPRKLRESGLQLLIEVGDEDANGNFRSVELLHRLLFDAAIEHDYHLHRGAAHVGRSQQWRFPEVFRFVSRALSPVTDMDPDAERHKLRAIQRGRYKISDVLHKAFIDVNEAGTEAAAATAVIVGVTSVHHPSPPPVFRADHPFLFALRDVHSGSLMFIGRVAQPGESVISELAGTIEVVRSPI